jgi:hypothetical protein
MQKWIGTIPVFMIILTLMQCGASNRLREYQFKDNTAASIMASPPHAQVFTDSFFDSYDKNIVSTALRIGTSIAKSIEAQNTQIRLDNAMEQVDVPEIIRIQTLASCCKYLHFKPIQETGDADFLFIMNIKKYGIDADSWSASIRFQIDIKVRLIDNQRNVEIWKKTIRVKEPVTNEMFGLSSPAGDLITAVALSELTEQDMIDGFSYLALYIADTIAERIHKDFIKAHSS